MSEMTVSALNTYPVKSCAGIAMGEAVVGERGLLYDREWIATRANGAMLTQRAFPQLALVRTELTDEALLLSAADYGEIAIPLDPAELTGTTEHKVDVFKKPGMGVEQGPEANAFFSQILGFKAMLLRVSQPRHIRPEGRRAGFGDQIGFADGAPILLASAVSLRALEAVAGQSIDPARIRANVWVDSDSTEAYDEDYWREIAIGELESEEAWACARCPMPNVDPDTGVLPKKDERFVTAALDESRAGIDPFTGKPEVFFGENIIRRLGPDVTVHVGDKLTVVSRSDERNFHLV